MKFAWFGIFLLMAVCCVAFWPQTDYVVADKFWQSKIVIHDTTPKYGGVSISDGLWETVVYESSRTSFVDFPQVDPGHPGKIIEADLNMYVVLQHLETKEVTPIEVNYAEFENLEPGDRVRGLEYGLSEKGK